MDPKDKNTSPEDSPSDPPKDDPPAQPFKAFTSKEEHDAYIEATLKERLRRKDEKLAQEREETQRKAREQALKDQEDWKKLAEERTDTIAERDKRIVELEAVEEERDTANDRVSTLEKRLSGLIKPRLDLVDEIYRPFLSDMPVEKQAEWLEKNAEKLATQGNGKPAGSRPTGPAATPNRVEAEREAREAHRRTRVSAI